MTGEAPIPLDAAYAEINALGGYVAPGDSYGLGVNATVEQALAILEKWGARDPSCPVTRQLVDSLADLLVQNSEREAA